MASTYTKISTQTVGAAGLSSFTFYNIPQNYTDLAIFISARSGSSGTDLDLFAQFNGDNGNNYSGTRIYGQGSTPGTDRQSNTNVMRFGGVAGTSATANVFGNTFVYISNYAGNRNKQVIVDCVEESNTATGFYNFESATLWRSTAAITSIYLTPNGSNLAPGSKFTLYGISNASSTITGQGFPYATGGDIIQTDGTYWYHAFLSSGTFTPQKNNLSCDALIVAGGGGAAYSVAGGGGAGGVLAYASQALTQFISVPVIIGAGGTNGLTLASNNCGTNGGNSQFGSLTSIGGGGGGGGSNANGQVGGSGGGAGGGASTSYTGGSGTIGQGYAGGNTGGNSNGSGAGGGGAGGAGSSVVGTGNGGAGGAGVNTVTGWGTLAAALTATGLGVSGYIAGGGGGGGRQQSGTPGGGAGGSGGGGQGGGNGVSPTSGTANTGSGGGSNSNDASTPGNGGSGLVIVRYAV